MKAFETGRDDIEITEEAGKIAPGRPIRLTLIGKQGGTTGKALSASDAMRLAEALLKAAGVDTAGLITQS